MADTARGQEINDDDQLYSDDGPKKHLQSAADLGNDVTAECGSVAGDDECGPQAAGSGGAMRVVCASELGVLPQGAQSSAGEASVFQVAYPPSDFTSTASSRYNPSVIERNHQMGKEYRSDVSQAQSTAGLASTAGGAQTVKFVEDLSATYTCSVCLGVLREPVQTACGHRFCRQCVIPIQTGRNPVCPVDRQPMGTTFPDKHCEREIGNLEVYCNYYDACPWKGTFKYLQDHLEKNCEFHPVSCTNADLGCTAKVERRLLSLHVERECEFRPIICLKCGERILLAQLKDHENLKCPETIIGCQQGACRERMPRKLMSHHIKTQCNEMEIDCELGCGLRLKRGAMADHVKSKEGHIKALYSEFRSLRMELQKKDDIIKEQGGEVHALRSEMKEMKRQFDQFRKMVTEDVTQQAKTLVRYQHDMDEALTRSRSSTEADGAGNSEKVRQIEQHFTDLRRQISTQAEATKEKVVALETDYKRTVDNLDLRVFELETSTYNGVLIWRFRDFKRHLENARRGIKTSHYSQPFYSSPHGYKMCARLYPNGDGAGHDKYLSIFFVIMAGQYDALLPWPFSRRVTLTLMDQSPARRDISETFMPDVRSTSFQRPTTGMNVASGCPCFVAHSVLLNGSSTYLKNDTLYLRIKIDTSGLENH